MRDPNKVRKGDQFEYTPFQVQELARCTRDPVYFFKNYIKVKHPKKGLVPLELYGYQERMLDALINHKDVIMLCSRQLGKTTIVAMYFLWVANFQENKELVIASKNMDHAVQIMDRVKTAYDNLPVWMKAPEKFNSRTMLELHGGSKIKSEATSEKTGRGGSPAGIMLDELAFASPRIQGEMWASLAPSLSTGGQFIVTSTPNGDNELFATLWRAANDKGGKDGCGSNGFFPVKAMWFEHPDRGQEYYDEMVGKLGPVQASAELDCIFVSQDALLMNSMKLVQLQSKPPTHVDMGFKFWQDPETLGGAGKTYLVGIDPATGSGKDFSVIQVFEFPSLEQVAEWRSNDIIIPLLYAKIKWILQLLSKPVGRGRADVLWTFERNGIGEAISALYYNDEKQLEHPELYNDQPNTAKLGVFTSGKTKVLACLQLKGLVERVSRGLKINSEILLDELKDFVAKGGTYEAKAGATDDCVMATILIVRLIKRLADYNDDAFKQINEYVSPDADEGADQFGDEPVPFLLS